MIENRHGLIVDAMATTADGRAECDAAVVMLRHRVTRRGRRRQTIGADKGYDTFGFVADTRALGVTPHVTQNVALPYPQSRVPYPESRVAIRDAGFGIQGSGIRD